MKFSFTKLINNIVQSKMPILEKNFSTNKNSTVDKNGFAKKLTTNKCSHEKGKAIMEKTILPHFLLAMFVSCTQKKLNVENDTRIKKNGNNEKNTSIVEKNVIPYLLLAMFVSYKQKSQNAENYIKANKLAPLTENEHIFFEQNYLRAVETAKNYNKNRSHARKAWLKLSNLIKIKNFVLPANKFNFKNFKFILQYNIPSNILQSVISLDAAKPLIEILGRPAMETILKFNAVKNDTKVSNIYALLQDVCIKGYSSFVLVKQLKKDPKSIIPFIAPLFTVAALFSLTQSFVFYANTDNLLITSLDRDIAGIGKKAIAGIAHETYMDYMLLPELKLVEKYPFFKPILFAKPMEILETGNKVIQLYKEQCEKEFEDNVKLVCAIANEPKKPSICTDKPNVMIIDDHIDDYVI